MLPSRRRYLRYPTLRPAAVSVGFRVYPGEIVNISLGGMCVRSPARVRVGEVISVQDRSGRGITSRGRVAWVGGDRFGLAFLEEPETLQVASAAV